MGRRPSSPRPSPVGRVTLALHGPIGELAAALRTLADALGRGQAAGAITYTDTVEAEAPGPAPGGMTTALADGLVAHLTPAAAEVSAVLCRNAPELAYEDLQAQAHAHVGISRDPGGGVLTSLAAAGKRLPLEVDHPIGRDAVSHRYRIEPAAAGLPLAVLDRAHAVQRPTGGSPTDG